MIYTEQPQDFNPIMEVVGCFVEHDGTFVLLQRQAHKNEPYAWGLPSGKVELGESLEGAMVRELYEETGISIQCDALQFFKTVYVEYENGRQVVYHMYSLELLERPQIRISNAEHLDACWVSPYEASSLSQMIDLDACIQLKYSQ